MVSTKATEMSTGKRSASGAIILLNRKEECKQRTLAQAIVPPGRLGRVAQGAGLR